MNTFFVYLTHCDEFPLSAFTPLLDIDAAAKLYTHPEIQTQVKLDTDMDARQLRDAIAPNLAKHGIRIEIQSRQ